MSDFADLYPGFAERRIDTSAGEIFARIGGKGPPLLLLHGYTQTHVMWHRVAPVLGERFSLVIPDLPGYGWSTAPAADATHAPLDKRSMARAMVEIMAACGAARFRLAGHDRGGRVAYRLALDNAACVERLATLDIVPTYNMWQGMDRNMAMKVWHWPFLAQPEPLPEILIAKAPVEYLE
jgi:haloacetate dehalogenase